MSQDDLGTPAGIAIVSLYNGERDRKAQIAKLAISAGVDEAAIRVAEAQMTVVGQALSRACDVAGVDAPLKQKIGAALREQFREIEAQPQTLKQLSPSR